MRRYLLGTLAPETSAALEDRYFSDDAFFAQVAATETSLILEYLDHRLGGEELAQFEARYRRIPELQRRLDEVRAGRRSIRRARSTRRLILTTAAAAAGLFLVVWVSQQQRPSGEPPGGPRPTPPVAAALTLRLTPGLLKSGGSQPPHFPRSHSQRQIHLVLELPGAQSSVDASATIRVVNPAGGWRDIWNSPRPARSTPSENGHEVTFTVDEAIFHPDDYVVALTVSGEIRDTYVFRVTAPR